MDEIKKKFGHLFLTLEKMRHTNKICQEFYTIIRMSKLIDHSDKELYFVSPHYWFSIPKYILEFESEIELYFILETIVNNDEMYWKEIMYTK